MHNFKLPSDLKNVKLSAHFAVTTDFWAIQAEKKCKCKKYVKGVCA